MVDIKALRKSKKLTLEELAQKVGVSGMTISRWEKDPSVITRDHIISLAKALNVDVSVILGISELSTATRLPVIGEISAGTPILAEENIIEYRDFIGDVSPDEHFYLRVKGDSMFPVIPNGSLVLFRLQPDLENGEIGAFLVNDDSECTVKRLKVYPDGLTVLQPENDDYSPILASKANPVRIVGKAVHVEYSL